MGPRGSAFARVGNSGLIRGPADAAHVKALGKRPGPIKSRACEGLAPRANTIRRSRREAWKAGNVERSAAENRRVPGLAKKHKS